MYLNLSAILASKCHSQISLRNGLNFCSKLKTWNISLSKLTCTWGSSLHLRTMIKFLHMLVVASRLTEMLKNSKCFLPLHSQQDWKPTIQYCWSLDEVIGTPFFGNFMSRNWYQLLLKFLHLNNNSKAAPHHDQNYDPLYKACPMYKKFRNCLREVYTPGCDLVLDEGTMLWKGNISFCIYNPNKPVIFGIKSFMISEWDYSYLCGWKIYSGKVGDPGEHGATYDVVMRVTEPRFRGKWHKIFMDCCYNSPTLFESLYQKRVLACGTVMPNRKGMPAVLKTTKLASAREDFALPPTLVFITRRRTSEEILLIQNHQSHQMKISMIIRVVWTVMHSSLVTDKPFT